MNVTMVDVLLKARKSLEQPGGWGQGSEGGKNGLDCISTALVINPTMKAEVLGFDNISEVWAWNDKIGRTLEEVLELIDNRIAFYRVTA